MWRSPTARKGKHILQAARKFATESATPQQSVPPRIPQPPSNSSLGVKTLKFIGLSLPLVAGGAVGYAWYDADFRKHIEDNIPYARELFENIIPKDDKSVPVSRAKKPEASLEKASILNAQEESAKRPTQQATSRKPASSFDTYSTAQCSSDRNESQPVDKYHGKDNLKPSQGLYASYIPPFVGKSNAYQQTSHTGHNEEFNETDEEDNEEEEEEEEEEEDEEEEESTGTENVKKRDSGISENIANVYNGYEDLDKKLTNKIMANKLNSFNVLTVPEVVQAQQYQVYKAENFRELLSDNNDNVTDDQASGLATSLQKSGQATQKQSDKISQSVTEPLLMTKDKYDKADNAALEVVIHKLATNSKNLVAEALKAQAEVAASIRKQTSLLQQALDDTQDVLQKEIQWEAVAVASKEKEIAMMRANELINESKKSVERLRDVLQEGRANPVTQNNPAIIPASKQYNEFLKDLSSGNLQVKQAEEEANVVQKYKDYVDKGKKLFQNELENLVPATTFGKKLTEEDLNKLLVHAHRRLEQLQRDIAEQLTMEKQRLAAALEAQRQEDLKITNHALLLERQRLQEEFISEKCKLDEEYFERVENEVRKQLARQSAAHTDHLSEALALQEEKLNTEFNRSLHTIILNERHKFHSEIKGWVSRLQGIEAAVEARATSEKLARYAQDLWLACIALNSALDFRDDSADEEDNPLKKRIDVILEAGHKHPFVETVARSVPQAALKRGVSTQSELENRFRKVSRICRRLGLVDNPNSSLYKYLISYLHSFVVLDHVVAVTEDGEVDLAKLDNFALISHAQYWIEKGNLDIALRFMVQLTGESRRAASDWINETRLLLESKQIANTLTAYASATGLANTL